MNRFFQVVTRPLRGTVRAASLYPAAMLSALLLALTGSIRVEQTLSPTADHLFSSLQLTLLPITALGMAAAVFTIWRHGQTLRFWLANGLVIAAAAGLFLAVWLGPDPLPNMTVARLVAATGILLFLFILLSGRPPVPLNGSSAFFLLIKAVSVAALYAITILLGLFFVAFAVETLLLPSLSEKIYMHIAIWSGMIGFGLFLGYLPVFGPGRKDDEIRRVSAIPRFIEILFAYVLIPLMALITIVLLIWVLQIILTRDWPSFTRLSTILSIYTLTGIWLSLMVRNLSAATVHLYQKLFPIAALVFPAFVLWALILQLQDHGLKTAEYFVALMILFAMISAVLLLRGSHRKDRLIIGLIMLLITVMIFPFTSFLDLPATWQAARLKNILTANNMLRDNQITPADQTLSLEVRQTVTDSAHFLLMEEESRKPLWFTRSLTDQGQFAKVMGFEPVYDDGQSGPAIPDKERYLLLRLSTEAISLPDIQSVIPVLPYGYASPDDRQLTYSAAGHDYTIRLGDDRPVADPELVIERPDGQKQLVALSPFFAELAADQPVSSGWEDRSLPANQMMLKVDLGDHHLTILFSEIQIITSNDEYQYQYGFHSFYITSPAP